MKNIDQIKALGFRVFIRNPEDTYAYFTDGNNIGYIQEESGHFKTTTVHVPNRQTGTGFSAHEFSRITKENLLPAFTLAPAWASSSDLQSVKKYATLEGFLKANNWGGGLKEVQ